MGSYIYTVRTRSIETNVGTAYPLAYLTKPHYEFGLVDAQTKRLVAAARAVWEHRGVKPELVFLATREDNRPHNGDPVYRWDGRADDFDEPDFSGIVERVGYLRRSKVGRRIVWTVEPLCYKVEVGTLKDCYYIVRTKKIHFSMPEVKAWIKDNTQPGEEACVETIGNAGKPALERVAAPSKKARTKMIERLRVGPWPAYPMNVETLTADERAAADELMAEGRVVLFAERYDGDGEIPYWHGALCYRGTKKTFKTSPHNKHSLG